MIRKSPWTYIEIIIVKLSKWLLILSIVSAAIIMLLSVADIIGAKIFNHGVPSTLEFIETLNVILVFGAVAFAAFDRGHMRADILEHYGGKGFNYAMKLTGYICEILVCAFLSWRLFPLLIETIIEKIDKSGSTIPYPLWPFVLIMFLGLVCLSLASIILLRKTIVSRKNL